MKIKSYAKINLILDVVERLSDNYHSLNMIMLLISLHDDLYININNTGDINIDCSNIEICPKEQNLVYKCLNLLRKEYSISEGFDIKIVKRIPMQAGLGGGSSNAASALVAANKLLQLNLSNEELAKLGFKIGSDIPFFIFNQHCNVLGKGEIVLPLAEVNIDPYILLVKPDEGVSTKEAYQTLDIKNLVHVDINKVVSALKDNDYNFVSSSLFNSLEQSSFRIAPSLSNIKDELKNHNFDGVLMSGSGSCVFAFTNDKKLAYKARRYFKKKYPFVKLVRLKKEV